MKMSPCPFCGGTLIKEMNNGQPAGPALHPSITPDPDDGPYYYECHKCGARGPYSNQRDRVWAYWEARVLQMSQIKTFVCPDIELKDLIDYNSTFEQIQTDLNAEISRGIGEALAEPGWKVTGVSVQWLNVRERLRNPDGDVGRWRVFVTRERA